jgi:ATP-dependent protease ClpP protease subunit
MADADTATNKSYTTIKATPHGPKLLVQKRENGSSRILAYITDIYDVADYVQLVNHLDTATEQDEVVLMLNSPGGDVFTGITLVMAMMNTKARTTTMALGDCASCAAFMWSFGKNLIMGKAARLMYHQSSHFDGGKTTDVRDNANDMLDYLKVLYSYIIQKGLLTEAEYAKMMTEKSDINLTSEDMAPRIAAYMAKAAQPAQA